MFNTCAFQIFFFKQKTAYEMRISDWSSDVCSSDLPALHFLSRRVQRVLRRHRIRVPLLRKQFGLTPTLAFLRRRAGGAALQRPVARELFQRRAEAGEVEVDAADPGFLELRDAEIGRAHV